MSAPRRAIVIVGVLAGVAMPAGALADTISFNSAFMMPAASGGGNPISSAVFSVPQFNPVLGTLDAVSYVVVRGGLDFTWAVDNEGSGIRTLSDAEPSARTSLHYFGGALDLVAQGFTFGSPSPVVLFDIDLEPDFTGEDAHTFAGTFSPVTLNESIVDPFLLGVFTGTGAVPLETRARFLPSAWPLVVNDVSLSASAAQWFWQYEYTPAVIDPGPGPDPGPTPVPEPATLSLVGLGAAALGLGQRHRRRARSLRRWARAPVAEMDRVDLTQSEQGDAPGPGHGDAQ